MARVEVGRFPTISESLHCCDRQFAEFSRLVDDELSSCLGCFGGKIRVRFTSNRFRFQSPCRP